MQAAVAWLLLLLACAAGYAGGYYYSQPPSNPYGGGYGGTACSPPFGYRHNPCGPSTLINRETVPACEYVWGPNVCLFTDTFMTNETEYKYKESCDWVYSHVYYQWIKQCSYTCQPTYECTDRVQVVERTYEQCCPGFVPRRPKGHSYYSQYYHYAYYTPVHSGPEGCPVACGDTLLECLQIQGLDEFISYLNQTNYFDLLNTSGSQLTVFAPTNAAFQQARAMGLIFRPTDTFVNVSMLVGNHIVQGNITHRDLEKTGVRIYTNVEGILLHRVSVSFDDYSYVSYNPGYSYYGSPGTSLKTTIIPFINGAEVVIEDACKTENGSLQIINMVLMPSNITIADILRLDPDFSMFVDALDSVNLLQFLENPSVSRTVFAVPDTAFNRVFPPDLRTCLSMYMRRPYNDIWLYHIAPEAHYNSSLALQNFFYTLLLQFLRVDVAENGTIFLGPDRVPITSYIPARNGVIHVIEGVLIPPDFNYGMCEQFVPTTEPPTPTPTEPMNITEPMNTTSPVPSVDVPSPSNMTTPTPTSIGPVGAPGQFNPFPPGP